MQALHQPPTLGTINISALSDTHCVWASLVLTPTAEKKKQWASEKYEKASRKRESESEGVRRARRTRDWPAPYNRAAIDHSSMSYLDKVKAVWAPVKSGYSRQDLHPCFTPVDLLFPRLQFTSWNTAGLCIDLLAVRVKSRRLFIFLLISQLHQRTLNYCDPAVDFCHIIIEK